MGHGSGRRKCEKIGAVQKIKPGICQGLCKFSVGMILVSMMGSKRLFKRLVLSAALVTMELAAGMGLVMAPVSSFAAGKEDCIAADCAVDKTGQKDALVEKDERLAREGDAAAQLALGLRYLMGNGVSADEAKAQEWLLKAAKQDNVAAQVSLATTLAFESDRQDLSAAAMWFEKAADAGNVQAMSELVRLYETGRGVDRDMAKADEWQKRARSRTEAQKLERVWKMALADSARWMKTVPQAVGADGKAIGGKKDVFDMAALKRAADNGDDLAQTVLGALLATGDGVARNEALAVDWFKKAADSGNVQAQAVLGELFALGWGGLKKDEEAAARWMEKAALGNLVPAEAEWGSMLMEGKGVKKDPAKGLSWIAKAAQEGDGRARLVLASMMLGQGDREGAATWFAGAAAVGDPDVLSALGAFYGWGDGPVAGESEKLSEVRRYAQRDESEAQLMMGLLYGEGWGTKRDPKQAEYWFDKAAGQNDPEVWLPLGLFYAETGRDDKAAEAFARAVAEGGFSLAVDGELLQLVFVDSGKMPDLGSALKQAGSVKKPAAVSDGVKATKKSDIGDVKKPDSDERSVRVAKKRAFLSGQAEKGNPAAQLMMARIIGQGWGVAKDEKKAASLRSAGMAGMCAALKEKAGEEPLCSSDTAVPHDEVAVSASGKKSNENGSNGLKVTEAVK